MISRHWRGLVKRDRASEYEDHLRNETLPKLRQISGFLGGDIFKRPVEKGVEFVVISRWASAEAIAKFAGADVEAAVIPAEIESMMVEYEHRARHYEFVEFAGR
jgi:heme-degrading monooxygenase HmoA